MWSGIKRVILWDFPRASWQYDIMVGAIVAFVFLTPRSWFRDQPRIPQSHEVAMLRTPQGSSVFWMEPELIASIPAEASEAERLNRIGAILKTKTGRDQTITRVEPIYDSEHEVKGYMAIAQP